MPASIVFTQGAKVSPPGRALIVDANQPVVCTNGGPASLYMWKLADVPIRSTLTRGLTSEAANFTFTPDVPGTYLVTLQINGSIAATENGSSFCAVLTSGPDAMGWRYRAAGESTEDNITYEDLEGDSLGFANNVNPRGWASRDDIEREQIEKAVRRVTDATVTAVPAGEGRLVMVNPQTGKIDPTMIPSVEFNQVAPADTWIVNHNLGRYPAVTVIDSAGNEVRGDVMHISVNRVQLIFNGAFSGTATCR